MKISIEVLEFPAEQNTKPFPILICKPIEIGNRKNILELCKWLVATCFKIKTLGLNIKRMNECTSPEIKFGQNYYN